MFLLVLVEIDLWYNKFDYKNMLLVYKFLISNPTCIYFETEKLQGFKGDYFQYFSDLINVLRIPKNYVIKIM